MAYVYVGPMYIDISENVLYMYKIWAAGWYDQR
jgi:hypothetical protein